MTRNALIIQRASKNLHVPTDSQLKSWIKKTLALHKLHKQQFSITLRIVNASESAILNQTYRQKSGATNVLSFVYEISPLVSGDIVLCAPLIATEAQKQRIAIKSHWAHLTVHGCLHLLGYDHIKKQDAKIMEAMETDILQALGFEDPYER